MKIGNQPTNVLWCIWPGRTWQKIDCKQKYMLGTKLQIVVTKDFFVKWYIIKNWTSICQLPSFLITLEPKNLTRGSLVFSLTLSCAHLSAPYLPQYCSVVYTLHKARPNLMCDCMICSIQ